MHRKETCSTKQLFTVKRGDNNGKVLLLIRLAVVDLKGGHNSSLRRAIGNLSTPKPSLSGYSHTSEGNTSKTAAARAVAGVLVVGDFGRPGLEIYTSIGTKLPLSPFAGRATLILLERS